MNDSYSVLHSVKGATVLVVDDNPNNLHILCNMLENEGYRVRPALNGTLALRAIKSVLPDIILLDIRMPEIDGYEVCRILRQDPVTRDIPVIFISALQETEDKVNAFKSGGVDYVVKPFQVEEVLARLNTHISLSRTRKALEAAYEVMESRVEERTRELFAAREEQYRAAENLKRSLVQTIEAMGLALEKRDPYTAGHQRAVSHLAVNIAQRLGLPEQQIDGLRLGSLVHDIGKIYVPAEILNRPGTLSDAEMHLIRTHPEVGYEIIKGVEFPWPVADMILQHHERLDGSGYPRGLKGNEILLEAQIMAIADVIEAMSSHRPYRAALGKGAAQEELCRQRGILYSPEITDAALAILEEGNYLFEHNPALNIVNKSIL
jgi:putative two-component system response regulator